MPNDVVNMDLYAKHFFSDVDVMQEERVSIATQRRILRLREVYLYWRNYPSLRTGEIVTYIRQKYEGVKSTAAMQDVHIIKQLLGSFEKDTKGWHQYNFNKKIMEVYEEARKKQDYRSAEKALADYAKYNRLDKEEGLPDDWWKDMIPQAFRPVTDPRTVGIEPMKDLQDKIKHYNKVFREEAVDADFEEVQAAARHTGELEEEDK